MGPKVRGILDHNSLRRMKKMRKTTWVGMAAATLFLALGLGCGGGGGGGGGTNPGAAVTSAVAMLNTQGPNSIADAHQSVLAATTTDEVLFFRGCLGLAAFLSDNGASESAAGGSSALSVILDQFGVGTSGRDLFNLALTIPEQLPSSSPTGGEVQTFLQDEFLPVLRAAAGNLEAISPGYGLSSHTLWGNAVEFDYADARLIASALRMTEAFILLTGAFDLDIDIDVWANTTFDDGAGSPQFPYTLFTGDSPQNIIQGQTCPVPGYPGVLRPGVLNEWSITGAYAFLLTAATADAKLEAMRTALIAAVEDFRAGAAAIPLEPNGDPTQDDDFITMNAAQACQQPFIDTWLQGVETALEAGLPTGPGGFQIAPPVIATFAANGCDLDLPALDFNTTTAFLGATYANRIFLPNLSLSQISPCVADANSFTNPTYSGAFPSLTALDALRLYQALTRVFEGVM